MKANKLFLLLALSGILFSSCSKDDHHENHDEELITTLRLNFTPVGGGVTQTYAFRDVDGPGGTLPTVDEVILAANTAYDLSVEVLNESVSPAEDITTEIRAEAEAHRLYYLPSNSVIINNFDTDADGVPLGLTASVQTNQAETGTLRVVLRHYPASPPNKSTDDTVESTKSVTDIDVTFSITIQ